ncbi:hypothetical protein M9H77_07885 [Catharanthus roseus]|uniref:Uncharacterized protein n=1 Tax=Catharanthus roseus TaxID=4058 RepID=A0ACC0BWD8_CATRO|nr:hypothetical protein M9H77_07885 [Catharanthus roseus]
MKNLTYRQWQALHLQSPIGDEKLQGPITRARARARRTKEKDDQIAHGFMMAIKEPMKEGLIVTNGTYWKREKSRRGFIMSTNAQLQTPHNEGTTESPHSNFDPMKVIMQELQSMRKEMGDKRRDITNVSMEHKDQINIIGHVTSHTQREVTITILMIILRCQFMALITSIMEVDTPLLEEEEMEDI